MAWIVDDLSIKPSTVYGASLTKEPISKNVRIQQGDGPLLVDIKASDVTVATGITAFLQDSSDGFTTVNNKKSVAITADGTFTISLLADLAGDQSHYPIRNSLRIVLDTGAGDTVTIDEIRIIRPE